MPLREYPSSSSRSCSPSGLTDGLLREIERVLFEAHPDDDRDGALAFKELLEHRVAASAVFIRRTYWITRPLPIPIKLSSGPGRSALRNGS